MSKFLMMSSDTRLKKGRRCELTSKTYGAFSKPAESFFRILLLISHIDSRIQQSCLVGTGAGALSTARQTPAVLRRHSLGTPSLNSSKRKCIVYVT